MDHPLLFCFVVGLQLVAVVPLVVAAVACQRRSPRLTKVSVTLALVLIPAEVTIGVIFFPVLNS